MFDEKRYCGGKPLSGQKTLNRIDSRYVKLYSQLSIMSHFTIVDKTLINDFIHWDKSSLNLKKRIPFTYSVLERYNNNTVSQTQNTQQDCIAGRQPNMKKKYKPFLKKSN